PESDRVRGHLSAAGGAAGPVLAEAQCAAAPAGSGDRDPQPACERVRPAGSVLRETRRRSRRARRGTGSGPPGSCRRRGARLHRRHRRRDKEFPVVAARGVPAWRDGAVVHCAVVGLAVGPRLRHTRRRQGHGQADAAAPGGAATGGRTRGRHRRRRDRGHPVRGARTEIADGAVVLTGRAGLIALLCALPVVLSPYPAATFAVLAALLAVAVLADVALAG